MASAYHVDAVVPHKHPRKLCINLDGRACFWRAALRDQPDIEAMAGPGGSHDQPKIAN